MGYLRVPRCMPSCATPSSGRSSLRAVGCQRTSSPRWLGVAALPSARRCSDCATSGSCRSCRSSARTSRTSAPRRSQTRSFVREALECAAIRETALRAPETDLAALEVNLRGQDAARERDDFDRLLHARRRAAPPALRPQRPRHRVGGEPARQGPPEPHPPPQHAEPGYLGEMIAEHRAVVEAVGRARSRRGREAPPTSPAHGAARGPPAAGRAPRLLRGGVADDDRRSRPRAA